MQPSAVSKASRSKRKELLKKYLVYLAVLAAAAVLIYIFVWFGTQLGLQG